MASYYYSSDKKNWNRGGNEYEIFLKALVGVISLSDYIWHPNMCESHEKTPYSCKCGALDKVKRILEMDLIPLWVFRKKGIIDHYEPSIHSGTQPIRVLNHMLGLMFVNTHPEFPKELFEEIDKGVFTKGVFPVLGEEPCKFHTPFVDKQKNVTIHETFLSYLWGVSYSVYVLFLETVDFPEINQSVGFTKYSIRQENIDKAYSMFFYAKSLIQVFENWDKESLPNPERYPADASDRIYIEQTMVYYTEAVKFILCHEFTHAQRHIDQFVEGGLVASHFLEFEEEADANAVTLMQMGMVKDFNQEVIEIGIIIAILSMFFFSKTTTGTKHPNHEDRLTATLERLQLKDTHSGWGIACIGLKLWDEQFNQNLDWPSDLTYRELYYNIVSQIKKMEHDKN
ncbi:MAG: phage exclusion protein Lit family protein [Saprospiraceae bacterium]